MLDRRLGAAAKRQPPYLEVLADLLADRGCWQSAQITHLTHTRGMHTEGYPESMLGDVDIAAPTSMLTGRRVSISGDDSLAQELSRPSQDSTQPLGNPQQEHDVDASGGGTR